MSKLSMNNFILFCYLISLCTSQYTYDPTTTRCGTSWTEANNQCGTSCPSGTKLECNTDEYCWQSLSTTPCESSTTSVPTSNNNNPSNTPVPTTSSPTTSSPTTPNPTSDNNNPSNTPSPTTPSPTNSDNYIPTFGSCGTGTKLSLTFDDGPELSNDATYEIIDVLSSYNIQGTFYVSPAASGDDEESLAERCTIISELINNGHIVQSHSWTHADFTTLTNDEIEDELDTISDFIISCGGDKPTIFRPPYGNLDVDQAKFITDDLGYIIGLWNMDTFDWNTPNDFDTIESYIDSIIDQYNDDSITLLMHDYASYGIISQIIEYFNGINDYTFINSIDCYNNCDTIDSYGICRDPNGFDIWTIDGWEL